MDACSRHPVRLLANGLDHVVGQDAEVVVAYLGELRFHGIAEPVEASDFSDHPSLAEDLVGLVPLGVLEHPILRPRIVGIIVRVQTGEVVVQDLRGVVLAGGIPLVETDPLMGGQIGHGQLDGLQLVLGMDLLDHPTGMGVQEPGRVQEPDQYPVEMGAVLPHTVLHPPGMEDEPSAEHPTLTRSCCSLLRYLLNHTCDASSI